MNQAAEKHLAKAATALASGESFYLKAAAEIIAAQKSDPTLTLAEIGERFGREARWVGRLVAWATDESRAATPFGGEAENTRKAVVHAKRILREAPMEQIEQMIATLPSERQQQVAAAAGHAYHRTRVALDEAEARLTPAERKAREADTDAMTHPVRKATAGFASLGIVGHIEQATEELRELVADQSITTAAMQPIVTAIDALIEEARVALAMVGLDADLEEVNR